MMDQVSLLPISFILEELSFNLYLKSSPILNYAYLHYLIPLFNLNFHSNFNLFPIHYLGQKSNLHHYYYEEPIYHYYYHYY
jgi:hypothetical protein